MRLTIFEKSENLGPTILMSMNKNVELATFWENMINFHFSEISEKFRNLKSYISHILINNY